MKIFLNLLGGAQGGQVTRAISFLTCVINQYIQHEIDIIIISPPGLFPSSFHKRFKIIEVSLPQYSSLRFLFRLLWENLLLHIYLFLEQPDVYLSFSHSLPLFPVSVPSVTGISNVAPFVSSPYKSASISGKLRLFALSYSILSAARKSTYVIALSFYCKDLISSRGISPSKISVFPNGLSKHPSGDHSSFTSSNIESSVEFGQSVDGVNIPTQFLLSVSNFYDYKNFHILIRAYALLPNSFKLAYPLLICGYPFDKKYYSDLQDLLHHLSLADFVTLIPGLPSSSLSKLYSKASAFIFPSLVENCPNSLLEAFAHGLPVICADTPSSREFAQDSALYFQAHSPHQLSNVINYLFASSHRLRHFAKLSNQRSSLYDWTIFTSSVIELCQQAVAL